MRPALTRCWSAALVAGLLGCSSGGQEAAPTPTPTPAPTASPTAAVVPVPDPVGSAAMAGWRAALAARGREQATVAFLGSSSTLGVGASVPSMRHVDRLQAALDGGRDPDVLFLGQPSPPGAGLRVYNGGVSGASVSDLLASPELEARLELADPDLFVLMVGANEFGRQVPPSAFAADLDRLLAVASSRSVLLVGTYQAPRADRGPVTSPWSDYLAVLRQAALDEPRRVAFVDVSTAFPTVNDAAGDPEDLIGPDSEHMTDAGYALMARLLLPALRQA